MLKKTNSKKTKSPKTKKSVDISNIEEIMEDMKELALQKSDEENVETKIDEEQPTQTEQKEIIGDIEPLTNENAKDTNEEDLSFVEKISNGEVIINENDTEVEEKPKNLENKPKRKTYEEMFGYTWCGYGYSI